MVNNEELDVKIAALKELTCHSIAALEKLANEKFEKINIATILQAKEYERRLDFLNGEASRLAEMRNSYVAKESYSIQHEILVKKVEDIRNDLSFFLTRELFDTQHEIIRKRIDALELNRANQEGKASQKSVSVAYIISAIGLIIGITGVILNLVSH
jgi:hypothetical protein